MANQTEFTPSQYNGAMQEVQRIHELYQKIHEYRRRGNLKSWNYELDALWEELGADKNVNTDDEAKFYKFHTEYAKYKNNTAMTYQILLRKELFLRRLQNRLGKGSRYQNKDDSGM